MKRFKAKGRYENEKYIKAHVKLSQKGKIA